VEIYVSKKRKHFSVPKDLLVYYSGYFGRRLDPSIEKQEADRDQFLLEDDADDFGLIVDYIYRGAVINALPEYGDVLKVERCISFIKLTGKLEIGEAASVIYPALKTILARNATSADPTALVTSQLIRIAFETIPTRNNVLELLARATLPETLKPRGGNYANELEVCDAFAAESWRQFQAVRENLQLSFPLSNHKKKTFI
jgi:hypothetical protein